MCNNVRHCVCSTTGHCGYLMEVQKGLCGKLLFWKIHLKSKIISICGCTSLSKHVNRMSLTEEKQHEHKLQAKQHPMAMLFCERKCTEPAKWVHILFRLAFESETDCKYQCFASDININTCSNGSRVVCVSVRMNAPSN